MQQEPGIGKVRSLDLFSLFILFSQCRSSHDLHWENKTNELKRSILSDWPVSPIVSTVFDSPNRSIKSFVDIFSRPLTQFFSSLGSNVAPPNMTFYTALRHLLLTVDVRKGGRLCLNFLNALIYLSTSKMHEFSRKLKYLPVLLLMTNTTQSWE